MAKQKKDLGAALQQAKGNQVFKMPVNESTLDNVQKSRIGKKPVTIFVDPAMHTALKVAAAQQGSSIQELGEQALQDILK